MLEKIREGSQGPVAKIILGAVILSFALAGIGGYLGQTTEQPVAEVNGIKISQTDFARAYQNERARLEQQFGEYFAQISSDPTYMAQIRKGVVDRLVQQELQNQLAIELGLRVSDEQVKQAIVEMPYFQLGGEFSNERYLQVIRQMNFQPDTFREYLREEMTRSQLVSAVAGTEFVLSNELKSTVALQQQTRALDYIVLSKDKVKDQVSIEEDAVSNYYELNQDKYQSAEQVSVQYLELKADNVEPETAITDADVLAYYEESKTQYLEPEKRRVSHILIDNSEDDATANAKAQDLLSQLRSGTEFSELASTQSDDIVSAELGGDLDWIERDMMDPEFETAAFALENVGDISEVVTSEFGYHIIQLTDIEREEIQPFDDVKADLRAELEKNAKVDAFYQKQTEIAELAFEMSDSLEDAALAAGVELKSTALINRSVLPAPLNTPAVTRTLFTPELLEDRVNSEVLEIGAEHIIVVRVLDYAAAATKPFDGVKAEIETTLVNEKASELINERAKTLFSALQGGKLLSDIATEEGVELNSEAALARQTYSVAPAIVTEVFKLPHPADEKFEMAVVALNNGDAALVQLKKVNEVELSVEIDEQQKQSITNTQINKNYLAFVNALEAKADVTRPQIQVSEQN
ncbi:SurA N-terminal domain-containing protein [Pseudoalteromonas sp. MMG012]|uniref:SurA N-terminal domain-containing protein n=1 Tax=Pseudoalteromonas sp. MMG012 TaxID=2822686 RepID=UPI001B3A7B33|nr:SurA N-terminal domain-containing protein [Pseudoalteromonas sp. MMG012]MBQ4848718.1 SurA N-terminal domain-containing protein [Pseudoalteromonas sp. MMG012]